MLLAGKYDRYVRTIARHASSLSTSWSATPLTLLCTADPPMSSSDTSSPVAAFTRCRPPSAIDDVPFTIGMKSVSAGMYAVPAAQ